MRRLRIVGALTGLCAMTACSSPAVGEVGGGHAGSTPAASAAGASLVTPVARTGPAATVTASPVAAAAPAPRVTITRVRTADGSVVTVATFRGPVQYVLHNGSQDPGSAAAGLVRAGPAVSGYERKRLLAAFNGGFKLTAGAGGYEQEGHVISPLHQGLVSLMIDRSGRARIVVWGRGVPGAGRSNLQRPAESAAARPERATYSSGGGLGPVGGNSRRRRVRCPQRPWPGRIR